LVTEDWKTDHCADSIRRLILVTQLLHLATAVTQEHFHQLDKISAPTLSFSTLKQTVFP